MCCKKGNDEFHGSTTIPVADRPPKGITSNKLIMNMFATQKFSATSGVQQVPEQQLVQQVPEQQVAETEDTEVAP